VLLFRPVRWDYLYDPVGRQMISLVRKLIKLRRQHPQFRYGDHYFYNHDDRYLSKGVLLFSRRHGDQFSLTALNFSDQEQTVPFAFPLTGNYREELHGRDGNFRNLVGGVERGLTIPSNYGCIWTL
jgi:maltooligosyltrehalose trehalohydrolase